MTNHMPFPHANPDDLNDDSPAPAYDSESPSILIIDDDDEFRGASASLIRGHGYHVEEATNGVDALEKLRWGLRPRVILLDMQMRQMTGWDFRAEQLRDPRLAEIPVVAMTAGPWKDRDLDDFSDRIEKPIDLGRLWAALEPYR